MFGCYTACTKNPSLIWKSLCLVGIILVHSAYDLTTMHKVTQHTNENEWNWKHYSAQPNSMNAWHIYSLHDMQSTYDKYY